VAVNAVIAVLAGEGEDASDLDAFDEKIKTADMPADVEKAARKQLERLKQMAQSSAEYTVQRTYLEWLVELPWSKTSADVLDLVQAKAILDDDHYGLDKVKERLLEFLGVRKLKSDMKGPILCLQGPPGVGKTALGRSIARAMGRSFVRVSLGGVRDEAEIRGHRRTYIGAMPGKIVQGLKSAGTANPVFILDEIDKLGADFRGDPSAALLEVLDPEQNAHFRDHYLNVDFDLSRVLFIATANVLDTIPAALRDRMEVISIAGYTELDKLHICRRHLVPKQLGEHGLTTETCEFTDRALKALVRGYTREAGLRNLERTVAAVCRKVARKVAEGRTGKTTVTAASLPRWLGPPRFHEEGALAADEVGTVTGLAWTQAGGEVLRVEAVATRGKNGLILTGQLGEVMKESARAALTWVRARAGELGVPEGWFEDREIHIHVPAGAIPKDGPSAGVSMATALVSVATGLPVKLTVAMTGEITLRGRVLAIGGLKEKLLAAHRHGIVEVVFPKENERDLAEVPAVVRKRLRLHPVPRSTRCSTSRWWAGPSRRTAPSPPRTWRRVGRERPRKPPHPRASRRPVGRVGSHERGIAHPVGAAPVAC
jgi:ATP-dependent Lon protease